MRAMANTTPIVTTVTKPATKEKTPKDVDATPRVNIQDFCEEYYEDSMPVIMDKIRRHRRQSAFDRISDTYSPSTTKSKPNRANFRDCSRGRSHPHKRDSSNRDRPQSRDRSCGVKELYDNSHSSYGTGTNHGYRYRKRDCSRHEKRGRESESLLSRVSESGTSDGGHWKSNSKRHKPTDEDDLMGPWMCEEVDLFTPRICNFRSLRKTRMPNNVKTYDGTGDPEDHVKKFQATAQVERWAMPTWCHMFNSTPIGAARQKKYVKDLVEIHNIKQKDRETVKDFMERFKVETERIKGASECMQISGFMHGVNNPELTKRLNKHVPNTMEEMMIATTTYIQGEVPREGRGSSRFTPLTRTPKEILAVEAGKFQPPPPMVTLVEKRSSNKFRDVYNNKGHEIKQGRDQPKVGKKEAPAKDKSMEIHMIQSWYRMTRQKVTQSFERVIEITFPSLTTSSGTEGPLVIEAEIGGHMIHQVKNQMVPATTSLTGFSGETIWPLGQLKLLVTIGDADHSTRAWMNFMIVRLLSPYNGIIGRSGIKEIQAVPSPAHEMLKFPTYGGIVTICSTILIPAEYATVITSSKEIPNEAGVRHENFKVAPHPNFPGGVFARLTKEKGPGFGTREGHPSGGLLPLPKINWKVESLCSYPFKCFLDAYKGYHQIQLVESDEEKTAFHTGQGVYWYTKMPFGLKNAGATYQRLVDKAFDSQIGRNIEVYIDDLVIKSQIETEMLRDIGETFPKNSLPLFKTMKKCIKKSNIHWTLEAKQAFKQLKQHLSELPLLVAPKPKEELIVYMSASYESISAVLMTEKAKTLRRYFQAHHIAVITDQPIKQIMSRPNMAGRLQKWSIMLGEHNITYRPRTSVKGQILADFLAEIPDESPLDASVVETPQDLWTLFTNGSSCVDGSSTGLILTSPEGMEFTYALRFQFTASNNEAEYEALIAGL
nr:reverse transcriptase domain-containing protein [Tanacetum cinerariifolium]